MLHVATRPGQKNPPGCTSVSMLLCAAQHLVEPAGNSEQQMSRFKHVWILTAMRKKQSGSQSMPPVLLWPLGPCAAVLMPRTRSI
jgi:hypothetical protein